MISDRLAATLRDVARDPARPGPWLALARLAERLGGLPDSRVLRGRRRFLRRLWRDLPDERCLGSLVLAPLGLRACRVPQALPGEWWRRGDRLGRAGRCWYDRVTGFPLEMVRIRDGVRCLLVPPPTRGGELLAVDRFPVTVRSYARFLDATGHPAPPRWTLQLRQRDRPVVLVEWWDAAAYARWVGGRLPTCEEWRWAASAGDDRRVPWGEGPLARPGPRGRRALPVLTNARSARRYLEWGRLLEAVGTRPGSASPFGVEELLGNVWEWLADPSPVREGPAPPSLHRLKVGGSWFQAPGELDLRAPPVRCLAGMRNPTQGFRVIRRLAPARGS